MKHIFLCEDAENVKNAYGTAETVYCKADVLENSEKFSETEFIFSTWGMAVFTEAEIGRLFPSLKAVFYAAGSVQAFARPFLNKGVRVFSAWVANAVPVAEYTVAQILLANKGFYQSARLAKTGDYAAASAFSRSNTGNYDVKIGIIGAGMVGKTVIHLLKAYKFSVLVFDPFLSQENAEALGVTRCSLETLFRECQVVSNHLADNEQTRGLLNKALFKEMRPYATFLNTGRGAQVAEADLIAVLKARSDLTAVLDVTYPEPPEKDSELFMLENCVLTPHIAGSAGKEVRRMGDFMLQEYARLIQNAPCQYEVTLKMLKTMA